MKLPPGIKECDLAVSGFPPTPWTSAGKSFTFGFGIYVGNGDNVEGFIPEAKILHAITHLKNIGSEEYALLLTLLLPEVIRLREAEAQPKETVH
jgi:hypothetical protein